MTSVAKEEFLQKKGKKRFEVCMKKGYFLQLRNENFIQGWYF